MTPDLIGIFSTVLAALFFIIPLKELKKEYLPFITAAFSILLFTVALKRGIILLEYLEELSFDVSGEYFDVLFKCAGVAFCTVFVSQMCSDFGMPSISDKVEFIGKIGVLMTVVPLVSTLVQMIEGML